MYEEKKIKIIMKRSCAYNKVGQKPTTQLQFYITLIQKRTDRQPSGKNK